MADRPLWTRREFIAGATAVTILGATQILLGNPNEHPVAEPPVTLPDNIYRQRIQELDTLLRRNPNLINQFAPEISSLAINCFSEELGYVASSLQGVINLHRSDQYRNIYISKRACGAVSTNFTPLSAGFTEKLGDKPIYIDIDFFSRMPHPATSLFASSMHELHHHKAPLILLETPEVLRRVSNSEITELQYNLGLIGYSLKENQTISTENCLNVLRDRLDESIVDDSVERKLRNLGLNADYFLEFNRYTPDVYRYRRMIIDPFFSGDNKPLLQHHQKTERKEYFELIGERMGHPSELRYTKAYTYLFPDAEVIAA